MASKAAGDVKLADGSIIITAQYFGDGRQLKTLRFQVRKTRRLKKMKIRYAKMNKISIHLLDFYFEGQRITDDKTPLELELENDSIVEVIKKMW